MAKTYGVTEAGFIRKPYEVIKKETIEKAKNLFGADADISIYSPIGLFVELLSWQAHIIWQELEAAYYSNWLDTAEGVNLDHLVKWGGLTRGEPKKAVIPEVEFIGTPDPNKPQGIMIPAHLRIETPLGIIFETNNAGTIDHTSELVEKEPTRRRIVLPCSAVEPGTRGTVAAGTLMEIVDPLEGLESAKTCTASIGGRDYETDAELRARYAMIGAESTGSSIDAIRSRILNVDGVVSAMVFENTDIENKDGRPPKSVECIVLGGDDQAIGQAIFEVKSAGIETFGRCKVTAYGSTGKTYDIYFNRPRVRNVYVRITIYVNESFNKDISLNNIKTNIIKYTGGVDSRIIDGKTRDTAYAGLYAGEDVYPWRIAAVNREIPGIEDIKVEIAFLQGNEKTQGYQDITFKEIIIESTPAGAQSRVSFVPDAKPGITGKYSILADVDLDPAKTITYENRQTIIIEIKNTTTWQDIVNQIDSQLEGAGAMIKQNEDTGKYFIRITSESEGEGSSIFVIDAYENGFLAALSRDVIGLEPQLEDPVDGMNGLDSDKLSLNIREIAQCSNENITIIVEKAET